MAYKPKYAAGRKSAPKPAAPTAKATPRRSEEHHQPPAPRKVSPGGILLSVLLIPLSLAVAGWLLSQMLLYVSVPKAAPPAAAQNRAILSNFENALSPRLNQARAALSPSQAGPGEDPTEPGVPEARPIYTIDEDTLVAPEPNPSNFGKTTDPEVLQSVIDEATYLLDGQQLYFRPDAELFEGSTVNYYLDDSIFAVTWKEVHDGSVYTFSEVKVTHPSQFRRHLADGEYGSNKQYTTTEMAESVNAVVASSGDFYNFRSFGIKVYKGKVHDVDGKYAETCFIDRNGDMHFAYAGQLTSSATSQAFVDEHDIRFSLCFGPILVDNYEIIDHTWYGVGEITEGYARAALCQMDTLHYIVVTANTEGPHNKVPNVEAFAKNVAATGCRMAYSLDGGQTAAIVMNDELINRPVYGTQRKISDIIYFATAIPEGG